MAGRYDYMRNVNLSGITAPTRHRPVRHDPLQDMLNLGAGIAPAWSTFAGGVLGGIVGGPAGAATGAGVGGSIGKGEAGVLSYGADQQGRDEEEAAKRRRDAEAEAAAQHQAALNMLNGLR